MVSNGVSRWPTAVEVMRGTLTWDAETGTVRRVTHSVSTYSVGKLALMLVIIEMHRAINVQFLYAIHAQRRREGVSGRKGVYAVRDSIKAMDGFGEAVKFFP